MPLSIAPGRLVLGPRNSPMKSWFAIMIKEATRIAEILTPADFIGHHGKPPYINPGSRSILKSQMGCGDRAPEDWIGGVMGARRGTRRI